ncbi:glycoside hydrolase superfamily [Aspergillus pseudonomiae]|uniref:Glycoside hydrolase superfamily n=1 Tax=Aspergillus pseudonomiae TaxID=1506151 RepID=A0A5N7DJL1_9EURO|nr:glycoside hydrolase superfamily [Aspergillus pseudonomiae]KAB8260709.1 glycoside hydrolase superfamily [Aspergillus pseudonomiae]KAE8406319.1 glycoside hydrolase superfamily [Aspergillus pseudonomiae]
MATQRKTQLSPVNRAWWKEASVYQIYPASFKDSNGDGIGDIPGIISELDYLKALGVDLVWLSPILQSPQVDMGYDVSDYYKIHAPYGTVKDVDALIQGLNQRGMRYVMDLVVNHTSDQHEWFKRSRSSRDNKYRDWYIWKKPKYGVDGVRQPPNNWKAYFGGSAWQYDETTDEYYLHLFAPEQPDLNWENPEVRSAVHQIMRYWLDKGVSGFRMDVINMVSKDQGFPDAPITDANSQWQHGAMYYCCGPRLHEYLQELGRILKDYDAFSVGEMPNVYDPAEIGKAVGFDRGELAMAFQFEIMDIDHGLGGKFSPHQYRMSDLKHIVSKWQDFMYQNAGWNALYLENHDQGRTISRFTSAGPEYRATAGKMLATFLGLQGGTPFVYQGQELGLVNVPATWGIEKFRDIETLNHWDEMMAAYPHDTELHQVTLQQFRVKSRDNGRTPMQWTSGEFAGFTTAPNGPWIDVHDDYEDWNAAAQVGKPNSVFQHWAKVLGLRKTHKDLFVYGSYKLVDEANDDLFAYLRMYGGQSALVLANFTDKEVKWVVPAETTSILEHGVVLLENYQCDHPVLPDGTISVKPFESFVILLDSSSARIGLGGGKL